MEIFPSHHTSAYLFLEIVVLMFHCVAVAQWTTPVLSAFDPVSSILLLKIYAVTFQLR